MSFVEKLHRVTDADGILYMLEMTAPSFGATLRLANDTRDWESNGNTYVGFPFDFRLPNDASGQPVRAQIVFDNVGREMTADLESLQPNEIITATIKIADKAAPNDIYREIPLPMTRVSVTPRQIVADCGVEFIMLQAAVKLRANPYTLPGIF